MIRQATLADVDLIAPLFDGYRQFYHQETNIDGGKAFLKARLERNESVIFIGFLDQIAVGFVQLYPIFSSVSLRKGWLLNDLFVSQEARRSGIAKELMEAAEQFGKETEAKWLLLETGFENFAAQNLYEKCGWKKEQDFFYRKYL